MYLHKHYSFINILALLQEVIKVQMKLTDFDYSLSKNLIYFCEKYQLNGVQLVKELKKEKTINKINILRAENYLKSLFL